MSYDRLAERYLDKVFPETRQEITAGDLKRVGIMPEMLEQAQQITAELTRDGIRPTIDEVLTEARRRHMAAARRGI